MKLPEHIELALRAKQFLANMYHRNGVPETMLVLTVEDVRQIIGQMLKQEAKSPGDDNHCGGSLFRHLAEDG